MEDPELYIFDCYDDDGVHRGRHEVEGRSLHGAATAVQSEIYSSAMWGNGINLVLIDQEGEDDKMLKITKAAGQSEYRWEIAR